ncbi:11011_t:CDS:2 [Cetraspora pellucida]|uniref:11011_t:CDS:1 n=1 Tax=Cetraspora pellucida TaxID=1433469 RepID=A0ACA9M501_9GLOM|nr:11011_t:CDS:2 [Cetraspora pellucida]
MATKTEDTSESIKPGLGIIEEAVNITDNTLSPIFPVIGVATSLINNILTIHEKIQFNEKTSKTIIDRIIPAETAIKFLKIRKFVKESLTENKQQINICYQEICHIKTQLEAIQAQQLDSQKKVHKGPSCYKTS